MALVGGGLMLAGVSLGLSNLPQGTRKTTDPPVMPTGKMGQDLFLAIDHRDAKEVERLLKAGADPNSRNGLEFTPLYIAAASHQPLAVDALLMAGAQVEAGSAYGTPLHFACATANMEDADKFLSRGANPNATRGDGMTPLMFAANAGFPPLVADLLKHNADVNAEDDGGASALSLAARNGNDPVVGMLLGAKASIEQADEEGQTPLMEAAKNGHAASVGILLKAGAKVDAKDKMGRTALSLAAANGDYPDVVQALLKAGAKASDADSKGRTAAAMASVRGHMASVKLLGKPSASALRAATFAMNPRNSVQTSLKAVQVSMGKFMKGANCVSCHQEGLGRMATGAAKDKGFSLDKQVLGEQSGRLNGMAGALLPLHKGALQNPEMMKQVPLMEINEISTIDSWLLAGMAAHGEKRSEGLQAMASVLAKQQSKDGAWTFSLPRVPMQSSVFTFTALSIDSLKSYAPKGSATDAQIAKGKQWLLKAPAQNSEDRAMRLLGLNWAGATVAERKASIDAIRKDQRPDGGWSQLPTLHSDAYATGQALYALRVGGGISASDPMFKKGIAYLLRTQDQDGSWFVNKRAIPANNYFDGGFPHGESQYSSFNGTCWAMMAMLQALPSK